MKKTLQLLVGLLISGVFLYYSFSKADFTQLRATFSQINFWWALPFVVVTMVSMVVRAARWHYLLLPSKDISTRQLFSPIMIGFAFNGIFPARAGEFARAWLVNRRHRVPLTSALATVIVERLYDLAMLSAVVLITFARIDFAEIPGQTYDSRWSIAPATLFLVLMAFLAAILLAPIAVIVVQRRTLRQHAVGLVVLAAAALGAAVYLFGSPVFGSPTELQFGQIYTIDAALLKSFSNKLVFAFGVLFGGVVVFLIAPVRHTIEKLMRRVPGTPGEKLGDLVHTVGRGLDSLTSWRLVLAVGLNTMLLWFLVAWTLKIMAWGFPGLESMTVGQGLAITMMVCLAIMIPAAPGYWGLYEVGCVASLQLLGITQDYNVALSYSLTIHALQMIPIISVGLIYAAAENVRAGDVMVAQEEVAHAAEGAGRVGAAPGTTTGGRAVPPGSGAE